MNRIELEAKIVEKFERLMLVELKSDVGGVRYYVATVYQVAGNVGRTENVMFFVTDEGTEDELARWGGTDRDPAPSDPTFAQEAQAWLQSKIGVTVSGKIIRGYKNFSADNVQGRAWLRLGLEDAATGELTGVEVALWRTDGQFQYKRFTAA